MYDIHCHALPGVDDGAAFPEESLDMIRMAADSGTEGLVLTPHCNIPGAYTNYKTDALMQRFRDLRKAVNDAGIPVRIYAGQEIFCTEDVPAMFRAGKLMTLNRSRYALTEYDFYEHPDFVMRISGELLAMGLVPVIAHPERYEFFREDTMYGRRLKSMGCLLQVNKGSLLGASGPDVQRCAVHLLEAERADVVASDAHSPFVRTTVLSEVFDFISEYFPDDYARRLLSDNPRRILADKTL